MALLPKDIQDKVYRPQESEIKNVTVDIKQPGSFGIDEPEED